MQSIEEALQKLSKSKFRRKFKLDKNDLKYINEIFDEDFKSLDEYKEEKNFKRVVEQITLEDIINAVKRAEKIRDHNKEYNKQIKYGKYIYYKENPDLEINESIEKILNDCEIL